MSDPKDSPQDTLLPKELNVNFKDNSPKRGSYKPSLWLRFLEGSERIFKILGAVAVPIVLFFAGQKFNEKAQDKTLSKEYMTIALDILKNKNGTDPDLYTWAVDLLNANAPVVMSDDLQKKLKTKTVRLMSAQEVYNTYQNSDPSTAVKEYSRILEKGTNEAILYQRAVAYRRVGKLDSAIMDYNQLLTMNPIHKRGYHGRGVVLMQQGQKEEACTNFIQAIELGYNEAKTSFNIHCVKRREKPKNKPAQSALPVPSNDEAENMKNK